MSKQSGDKTEGIAVKIYKLTNRLKGKLGVRPAWTENEPGHIADEALKEGLDVFDEAIAETSQDTK